MKELKMTDAILTDNKIEKICSKCHKLKSFEFFEKQKAGKFGYRAACRQCRYDDRKKYEVSAQYSRAYYHANKHKNKDKQHARDVARKDQKRQYYNKNRDKVIARALLHAKENKALFAHRAMWRHTQKLQATPSWVDIDLIKSIYLDAKIMSENEGIKYHVDHVIPLKSELVCGLHVHTNLSIITAAHNIAKGNRHWPDMP